jgi:hypothetical protein
LSPATMLMVWWQPWILIIRLRNGDCLQTHRSQVCNLFCSIMATFCLQFQLDMQSIWRNHKTTWSFF